MVNDPKTAFTHFTCFSEEVCVIHVSTWCIKTGVRSIFAPADTHRLLSRGAAKGLSGRLVSCDIALHMHINLFLAQPLSQRKEGENAPGASY